MLMRLLELGEKHCQKWQGKGIGGRRSMVAEVRAALLHLPPGGAVVFDVGANRGEWTRELLARAGSRVARVYCFEPSMVNHADLLATGDGRMTLVNRAIAESPGQMTLFADRAGSGAASLLHRNLDHRGVAFAPVETVAATTIDVMIGELGIGVVHFAKFDIEGLEYRALLGAEHALKAGRIRALAFEFGGTDIDSRNYFRDFWYLLSGHGYRIALINPLGPPRLIERYGEELEIFRTTNFIAWTDK
jgi:FkbM family methyltransferase